MSMALIAALLLLAAHSPILADGREIDLTEASIVNDRGDFGYHMSVRTPPQVIIDGDPETVWSSGPFSFALLPANLFITLPEPAAVGRFEMLGTEGRQITNFEVYARVDDGWALLGEAQGGDQALVELDLIPAEVEMLRVRIGRQPARNSYNHIRTVRLFAPPVDAELVPLSPEEVAGETPNERVFVREALGLREREPRIHYDAEKGYLGYVTSFLDTMIEHGTDRYGEVHSPMFVGMLEIDTHEHPYGYLPSIPGQRWWDRPVWGSNLGHDRPLLEAMEYVGDLTGDEKYRDAARAYLQFFLDNCTDTPTGLWPWGEHVYWDFYRDRYSSHYPWAGDPHELEGRGSMSFWEIAWNMNPEAVLGQAGGLINHVKDLDTFVFCRHANISEPLPDPRPEDLGALDFQAYGALFMRIWAFAWSKSGDETLYGWIERMADYYEDVRLEESGMLPVLSKYASRPLLNPSPGGTLGVGLSMLEASELLAGTEMEERLRRQGTEYVELAAAQDATPPEEVGFDSGYVGFGVLRRQILDRPITMFVGNHTQMLAYRVTGDERHLEAARQVAEAYAAIEEVPEYDHLRANVFGRLIHMMLDMYEFDPDERWLEAAERFAQAGIEGLYGNGLFRGATNQWIYDSHLYVSSFVHGLVRLHAVIEGEEVQVPPLHY